jgi:hypothetical protein
MEYIEWLGYLASILVAISFLMKSIAKLRFLNMIGAICFVIYAIGTKSFPVALINSFIVCVNVYYLTKKKWSENDEKTRTGN